MYCKANFKSVAKCKKRLCTAVFALFKKNTRRVAWPVLQSRCKALSALSQNTLKNTKTGRKSVGFLILTQAPKCTRSHCFPPQKHPKNGFVMRFAGKNSFFQLRARDFSFYMNAYSSHSANPGPLGSSVFAKFVRYDTIASDKARSHSVKGRQQLSSVPNAYHRSAECHAPFSSPGS